MLSDITAAFETRNPGVASFETFAAECVAEIARDPVNAGLYFLLGQTARQFCEAFADRPLTVEIANERKEAMLSLAHEAVAALDATAEEKLAVLNRIAVAAGSD